MWLTGFIGSFYILFMFIAAPKIGAANTLLWVFLGQMYIAMLLSQTGWFGLDIRRFDVIKLLGLLTITLGGFILLYAETRPNSYCFSGSVYYRCVKKISHLIVSE